VAVRAYSWTGIYIGANVGYGWGSYSGTAVVTTPFFTVTSTSTGSSTANGAIVGGQIGGNYQVGIGVVGLEIDGQWSNQKNTLTAICGFLCTATGTAQINAFGTARARLGVAIDRVLLYATAGVAWTNAKDTITGSVGGVNFTLIDTSGSKVGWTAGAGLEVAIGAGFSAKVEYLYIQTDQLVLTGALPTLFFLGGGTVTQTATIHDSIARVGVNYKFGG
jgi:outer membrane immunogenic protein